MAVKEWFRRLQPVQLYLVLFFTVAFFLVEIIASHVTHSLTLLLNAYHMLCNIVALIGCIASVKYAHRENYKGCSPPGESSININEDENNSPQSKPSKDKQSCSDRRMKNTFGWARIDILTMLVCCVILASFCFSLIVEALQTLIHINHLDEMHHPLPVMCIGVSGILLNGFCYIIIGGYTFNQGIFLHVTKEGNVVLQRKMPTAESVQGGEQRLSSTADGSSSSSSNTSNSSSSSSSSSVSPVKLPRRQGFREMLRDALGCLLVVIASIIVYFTDAHLAKFIDPVFAIISAISLFVLSYPYVRESGLILLQTIPNHININSLKKELLAEFPGIVNVHDLHVWHLAGEKVISTAHIIFLDPIVYASITDQVTAFFIEMGITQVTIQPEFHKMKPTTATSPCLIRCQGERCRDSQCCSKEGSSIDDYGSKPVSHLVVHKRFVKHEIIPSSSVVVDLKKFTLIHTNDCNTADNGSISEAPAHPSPEIYSSHSANHRKSCPDSNHFPIDAEIVEPRVLGISSCLSTVSLPPD